MSGIQDPWNTGKRAQQQESQSRRSSRGMQGSQAYDQGDVPPPEDFDQQPSQRYGEQHRHYGQLSVGRSPQPLPTQQAQGRPRSQGLGLHGTKESDNLEDPPQLGTRSQRGSQSTEASDITTESKDAGDEEGGKSGSIFGRIGAKMDDKVSEAKAKVKDIR
ncbi:hypothetical protein PAAG_06308 [Paracoccidioides lutzii Pb01]|uniref:Uncharacterized protein n=1 Tax=Paracoccidioides lutzii (strain ATCC MYA-826 / Pb01) TaxID=502779 RepID=C1H6B7_PARBA|nr:hypothetical protein PAAG_06308 [Paracoccidioides lutzii Pb01]EEH35261.1 hypothetical protein PAAG_06308 [Paracoccidioides lutzii Pb01]